MGWRRTAHIHKLASSLNYPFMKYLFLFARVCLILLLGNLSGRCYSQCGNNDKNGITSCPCLTCPRSGDPFNPYNGNEHREIIDLEISGAVGEAPLTWARYANSRIGFLKKFGTAHNWN